jgi:hypothetical protein
MTVIVYSLSHYLSYYRRTVLDTLYAKEKAMAAPLSYDYPKLRLSCISNIPLQASAGTRAFIHKHIILKMVRAHLPAEEAELEWSNGTEHQAVTTPKRVCILDLLSRYREREQAECECECEC